MTPASVPGEDRARRGTAEIVSDAWEPGDGIRYELLIVRNPDGDGRDLLVWINAPGGGRTYRIAADRVVGAPYLQEKMRTNDVATLSLLRWLAVRGYICLNNAGIRL